MAKYYDTLNYWGHPYCPQIRDFLDNSLCGAIMLASDAHTDQFRADGSPYILHPIHVMNQFSLDEHRIPAVLHDVVEDSLFYTLGHIEEIFGVKVAEIVDCLTKRKTETIWQYWARVKANPVATAIKIEDIRHNYSTLDQIDDSSRKHRMWRKYQDAAEFLEFNLNG